jgi:hypothetical protein
METKIVRIDKENGKEEIVALSYALTKLSNYWNDAEELLLNSKELDTPFATYKVID